MLHKISMFVVVCVLVACRPATTTPLASTNTVTPISAPSATSAPTLTRVAPTNTAAPTPVPIMTRTSTPTEPTVDQVLARCPTAQEVAAINGDLRLSFETGPTAGKFVCTAAAGSADLTLLQRRYYQTLIVTKQLQFSQPLPWTDKPLYSWLVSTIKGIRIRSDITLSSCCDPKDTINLAVASNDADLLTDRWVEPRIGVGLMDLMILFVHEARHNQGYRHMCGTNDKTIAEMGAGACSTISILGSVPIPIPGSSLIRTIVRLR